jgi:hypothetical protein
VNLRRSGLIGVRMPATVPLRYRGPREVNPLRGSAKDQGVGLPCPDRDSHPSEVGRRAGPETLSHKQRRWQNLQTQSRRPENRRVRRRADRRRGLHATNLALVAPRPIGPPHNRFPVRRVCATASRIRRTLGRPESRAAGFPFQLAPAAQRGAPACGEHLPRRRQSPAWRGLEGARPRPGARTIATVAKRKPAPPLGTPPGASSRAAGQLTLIRSAVAASAAMQKRPAAPAA